MIKNEDAYIIDKYNLGAAGNYDGWALDPNIQSKPIDTLPLQWATKINPIIEL